VLPAGIDLLRLHVRRRRFEVVRLEVAEHLVAVPEDRVVPDAGRAERREHVRPDGPVRLDVLVDLVGSHAQDEGAALRHVSSFSSTTSATSVRGPWTPSTRLSSMSDVADGPEMNVSGRRSCT